MARETTHENINKQSTFRIFHFMKQIVNENQTLRLKNNRKVLFQFPIGRLPFFFCFFLTIFALFLTFILGNDCSLYPKNHSASEEIFP